MAKMGRDCDKGVITLSKIVDLILAYSGSLKRAGGERMKGETFGQG